MGTTWVLHTETKGTGAEMVPLERVTKRSTTVEPVFVPRKQPARRARTEAPAPKPPRKFRIVDVMTRRELLDGAGVRETIDALREVRSIVDVNVYGWHEERGRWRLLTLSEQRLLFDAARSQPTTT